MGILIQNQFNELRAALDDAFVAVADLDMAVTPIGHPLESIIIPGGSKKPFVITVVIKTAESEGWTRELIRVALSASAGNQKLRDFIANHPEHDPATRPPVLPDYYQSETLVGGQVFLRRPLIRDYLKKIGVDNNARVMTVTGPPFTGKTYSIDFITFVLENDPAHKLHTQKVVYIDLDKFSPGPLEVARRVCKKLGMPDTSLPQDKGEQAARMLPDLIDCVIDAATNHAADTVWIVLDGFYTKQPVETDDFITAIVKEANRTAKLRVVLLNYRLPPLVAPFALKEEIEAPPFNRDHMKTFIESVYKKSGKKYTEPIVEQAVDDVIQSVQAELDQRPGDKDRLIAYLSSGLATAAQRLAR